jgi:hypothetical protein
LDQWLRGNSKKTLLASASAFFVILLNRNDIVFNKSLIKTFSGTLQRNALALVLVTTEKNDQNKELIHRACLKLETMAMHRIIDYGWRLSNMIYY